MPEVLTLDQAAAALAISRRRLYDWMLEASISASPLPTNARVKTLTLAQVELLARTHARTLKPLGFEAIHTELAETRERLVRVETQLASLETRFQTLEALLAPLLTSRLQTHQEEPNAPSSSSSDPPASSR
jgi:hypothetical protein